MCMSFFFLLDFFHLQCKYLFTLNTKAIDAKMGVRCIELVSFGQDRWEQTVGGGPTWN